MQSAEHHAQIDPVRNHVPDPDAIVERYREGRQHPSNGMAHTTLVAEDSGVIVGFIDARIDEPFDPMYKPVKYCFIADIAVDSDRRGQGIGEQLMRAIEAWAREQGAEFVVLEYHMGNPRAADLYARLGYRRASIVAVKETR